jgi:hypothetical protein
VQPADFYSNEVSLSFGILLRGCPILLSKKRLGFIKLAKFQKMYFPPKIIDEKN